METKLNSIFLQVNNLHELHVDKFLMSRQTVEEHFLAVLYLIPICDSNSSYIVISAFIKSEGFCGKNILYFNLVHLFQVSGELSNNGQPMRRFMQTFVLAPGEVATNL